MPIPHSRGGYFLTPRDIEVKQFKDQEAFRVESVSFVKGPNNIKAENNV